MKLNLSNLTKYKKVITRISTTGHPKFENLYFDFQNKMIFAQGPKEVKAGIRVDMALMGDETFEQFGGFYVPAMKLLSAISRSPEDITLTVDGKFLLSNGDSVKLKITEDPTYESPEVFRESDTEWILEDEKLMKAFETSLTFAEADIEKPLCGVFIENGILQSSDESAYFMYRLNEQAAMSGLNLPLPLRFARLFHPAYSASESALHLSQDENAVFFHCGDIGVVCSKVSNLEMIGYDDPEFQASIRINNYIKLDTKTLRGEFNYLSPFYMEAPGTRIKLTVVGDDLHISVTDTHEVLVKVPILSKSEGFSLPDGYYFWLSGADVKQTVFLLNDDEEGFTFRINPEGDSVTFEDNEGITIVQVLMDE